MLKLVFSLLSAGCISFGFAQRTIPSAQTNGIYPVRLPSSNQGNILASAFEGERFRVKAGDEVEGNPLLFEDWRSGEVILVNDEKYFVDKINLDASNNRFIYYKNDTMYEFYNNVKEIRIYGLSDFTDTTEDMVFRSDIYPVAPEFVQVLARGKITMLQGYTKKPKGENYSNGIVNNTRKYTLDITQNALVNDKLTAVKYNRSTLDELTSDKKTELEAFIKTNNLKLKNRKDFLKAVLYYNSNF